MSMEAQGKARKKVAIIVAPDDKGRQQVFGIPAVRRLALLIQKLGVAQIHLIGRIEPLKSILCDLVPQESFHPVETPAGLAPVVADLALPPSQRILLLKANHVIDRPSLTRLLEADGSSGPYFMEGKGNKGGGQIYLTTPAEVVFILRDLWSPSCHPAPPDPYHRVLSADGLPVALDGGAEESRIVEGKLMAALAAQTAGDDGFLARHLSRRVSRFMSRRIVLTSLTPNQITLGGAGIGMMGALLLSRGDYWPQLIGSLLFLICIIVDGVDGEIARLKLQESSFGHRLDIIADNIVHVAIFAGLALGLYHASGDPLYLHLLWILLGGFALCGLAVYRCILRRSSTELEQSGLTIQIMALMSNRDFAYILVVLALVQRLHWFLIGAAAGTYLFAATLWAASIYEKRALAP